MAAVESYETLKGTVQGDLTFHFDVSHDVLYLRLASMQGQEVFGEETSDGFLLFRNDTDEVAGLTVLDYWKRFGAGRIEEMTLRGLQSSLETRTADWQQKLAA